MYAQFNSLFVDFATLDAINAEKRDIKEWADALCGTPKPATTRKPGKMARIYELILAGKSNMETLAIVRNEFGETPKASVAWARNSINPGSSKHAYAKKFM